jgi:hypothetical protein
MPARLPRAVPQKLGSSAEGLLLCDFFPELLKGGVVGRIRRQLTDLKPGRLLGEAGSGLRARGILLTILNEDNGLGGLLQHLCEQGNRGGGVETACP